MNNRNMKRVKSVSVVGVFIASALVLSACVTTPVVPQGAAEARSKLTALQNDPQLVERAPMEIREAEAAVRKAEKPLPEAEAELARHRVDVADRKVEIARARAETRYAEDQRVRLAEERDAARLKARTREADRARTEADKARAEAADMQRQIEELEAEATDRGLVLTLGDVLFATGSARLQGGADRNLGKLAAFLNKHPERRVLIEGHTDSVGSAAYNRELSRQRAESVRSYLVGQDIAARRLTVAGMGMDRPVASNETAMGRQQNRRVEIIIENQAQSGLGTDQSASADSSQ
jgi:outer membrane protein OmpA-like peptidoglycan-associated protein